MVSNTDGHPEREAARIEALLDRRVAGVAMLQFSGDRSVIDELHGEGVPVTVISCFEERTDCVTVDESTGLGIAVQHLARLGHERLAYVTSPLVEEYTNDARHQSFLRECARAGCSEAAIMTLDVDGVLAHDPGATRDLERLLGSTGGPTGFAAANDIAAIALIEAAERLGASVPHDISVVGFDGITLGGLSRIGLTTVAAPREEMAETGMRLLMDRIDGDATTSPRHVLLEPELVLRASTAPPR
jgi:LacI family transcriptional regulator